MLLAVAISCPGAACYGDRDVGCDSDGYPDSHVAGRGAHGRAERGSEGDGQAECPCAIDFFLHECLLKMVILPSAAAVSVSSLRDSVAYALIPSAEALV
jgi:hypothetical protein